MKTLKQLIIPGILFLLSSCGQSNTDVEKKVPVDSTANYQEEMVQDTVFEEQLPEDTVREDFITNENVREKLLEYGRENPESIVDIYTTKGKIRARLFKDTPLHRANFIMLTKVGYFTGSMFSRIHKNFIAQTGGTYEEEKAELRNSLGNYTIPQEITKNHFHKAGALGAARRYEDNPEKRSHPHQFYFIEGSRFNEVTLDKYEKENNYNYPLSHREFYLNNRGSAHLDGQHTVFGEIISGLDVVSKLTSVAVSSSDRPYEDLYVDSVIIIK